MIGPAPVRRRWERETAHPCLWSSPCLNGVGEGRSFESRELCQLSSSRISSRPLWLAPTRKHPSLSLQQVAWLSALNANIKTRAPNFRHPGVCSGMRRSPGGMWAVPGGLAQTTWPARRGRLTGGGVEESRQRSRPLKIPHHLLAPSPAASFLSAPPAPHTGRFYRRSVTRHARGRTPLTTDPPHAHPNPPLKARQSRCPTGNAPDDEFQQLSDESHDFPVVAGASRTRSMNSLRKSNSSRRAWSSTGRGFFWHLDRKSSARPSKCTEPRPPPPTGEAHWDGCPFHWGRCVA